MTYLKSNSSQVSYSFNSQTGAQDKEESQKMSLDDIEFLNANWYKFQDLKVPKELSHAVD